MNEIDRIKREYLLGHISHTEAVNTLSTHCDLDRAAARAIVSAWAAADNNEVFSQ